MIDTGSSKSQRRPSAQTTNTRSDPSQIQQAGFITATDATMHNSNGAKLNDLLALKFDTNASPKRIDTTSHISHQPDRQETKKQNIEKCSRVYFSVKQSESPSSTVASPRTDRHVNSNTNSLPRDCPGVVSDTALHARTPKPASLSSLYVCCLFAITSKRAASRVCPGTVQCIVIHRKPTSTRISTKGFQSLHTRENARSIARS